MFKTYIILLIFHFTHFIWPFWRFWNCFLFETQISNYFRNCNENWPYLNFWYNVFKDFVLFERQYEAQLIVSNELLWILIKQVTNSLTHAVDLALIHTCDQRVIYIEQQCSTYFCVYVFARIDHSSLNRIDTWFVYLMDSYA